MQAYNPIDATPIRDRLTREILTNIQLYLRELEASAHTNEEDVASALDADLASFVTVVDEATLVNSRQIVATSPVTLTDSGVGGTLTVSAPSVLAAGSAFTDDNRIVRTDTPSGSRHTQQSLVAITDVGDILPAGDNTQDLGSAALRWNDIFYGGVLTGINETTQGVWDDVVRIQEIPGTTVGEWQVNQIDTKGLRSESRIRVHHKSATFDGFSTLTGKGLKLGEDDGATYTMLDIQADAANAYASFTADHNKALRFFAGQDGGDMGTGAAGIGFYCDGSDDGSPAANLSTINFEKLSNDSGAMVGFVTFSHTATWGTAHWVGLYDTTGAAVMGGFTVVSRCDHHDVECEQYLDPAGRWQKVDGLQGGGYGGIDAGTTEPVT